jgi:hypothetical protein
MRKVFIFDNWIHLTKNPPLHSGVDYIFNNCEQSLKPIKIINSEIINAKRVILTVIGMCQEHGEVEYYVSFVK